MTDRLVQQDARATGTHHDRHLASFGLDRLEKDRGLVDHLSCQLLNDVVSQELGAHPESPGGIRVLDLVILLHDAHRRQRSHRTIIIIDLSFRITEQDMRSGVTQRGDHLIDSSVLTEYPVVELLQERLFLLDRDLIPGGLGRIKIV